MKDFSLFAFAFVSFSILSASSGAGIEKIKSVVQKFFLDWYYHKMNQVLTGAYHFFMDFFENPLD